MLHFVSRNVTTHSRIMRRHLVTNDSTEFNNSLNWSRVILKNVLKPPTSEVVDSMLTKFRTPRWLYPLAGSHETKTHHSAVHCGDGYGVVACTIQTVASGSIKSVLLVLKSAMLSYFHHFGAISHADRSRPPSACHTCASVDINVWCLYSLIPYRTYRYTPIWKVSHTCICPCKSCFTSGEVRDAWLAQVMCVCKYTDCCMTSRARAHSRRQNANRKTCLVSPSSHNL